MRGSLKKEENKKLEILFKQHYDGLCSFVFRYIKDDEIAEEIVQQFFVDFLYHRRFRNVHSNIKSYLYSGVKYATFNYLKSKHICREDIYDDMEYLIVDDELQKEKDYQNYLQKALNILPPKCKRVFVMVHIQKLSYQETSDILGVSINTTKTHIKRAFNLIRTQLDSPFSILIIYSSIRIFL